MAHYIRILSPSARCPSFEGLRARFSSSEEHGILSLEHGEDGSWTELMLADADGSPIGVIERNLVQPGSVGSVELDEFLVGIESDQPASAVAWLKEYLPGVRCIYAIQILAGVQGERRWPILHSFRSALQSMVGGIVQADWEGFSNEEGFLILWQFLEGRGSGNWWVAVLQDGAWVKFRIDAGNREHREAFLRGELPQGVDRA